METSEQMNCKRFDPPPQTIANALMLAIGAGNVNGGGKESNSVAKMTQYECTCRLEPPLRGDCLALLTAEKVVQKSKEAKKHNLEQIEAGEEQGENGENGENGEEIIEITPEEEKLKSQAEKSFSQCVEYIWSEVYRERSGWVEKSSKETFLQSLL